MKTLVEMAKELGITPRPNLTEKEWRFVTQAVGHRLLQEKTGLPETERHEKERRESYTNLPRHLYLLRANNNRHWPEGALEKVAAFMKKEPKNEEIVVHAQEIGVPLDKTNFIWHDYFGKNTANVYVRQPITSEMTQELYDAVAPCLCPDHQDRLNGLEIQRQDGQILKGIKIGPEIPFDDQAIEDRQEKVDGLIYRDIPESLRAYAEKYTAGLIENSSLGAKSAAVQTMDLMYYLMGKEGKSPFRLTTYEGNTYQKEIVVTSRKSNFWRRLIHRTTASLRQSRRHPTINWRNPSLWRPVSFISGDKVLFSYRINASLLTNQDKQVIRQKLSEEGIRFTERAATADRDGIRKGDLTFRLSDEDSIRRFQKIMNVGYPLLPVSVPRAEYNRQQKKSYQQTEQICQERSKELSSRRSPETLPTAYLAQKRGSSH